MKALAAALLATSLSTGTFGSEPAPNPKAPSRAITVQSTSSALSQLTAALAEQLFANNRSPNNASDSRIAITTFVSVNSIEEADRLGLTLSENLMHEMHLRGFEVVDFKTRDALKIRPSGDFVFSRNTSELRREYDLHYFVAGTITRNPDGAMINARLIQASDGTVVSTAQSFIGISEVKQLLNETSQPTVERIVLERLPAATPVATTPVAAPPARASGQKNKPTR